MKIKQVSIQLSWMWSHGMTTSILYTCTTDLACTYVYMHVRTRIASWDHAMSYRTYSVQLANMRARHKLSFFLFFFLSLSPSFPPIMACSGQAGIRLFKISLIYGYSTWDLFIYVHECVRTYVCTHTVYTVSMYACVLYLSFSFSPFLGCKLLFRPMLNMNTAWTRGRTYAMYLRVYIPGMYTHS